MKVLIYLSIIIVLICPILIANEPNDPNVLRAEITKLKKEIADYKHKIQVAKRNIVQLEKKESRLKKGLKLLKRNINYFGNSEYVKSVYSKDTIIIGDVLYIPFVKIKEQKSNFFLAEIYCLDKYKKSHFVMPMIIEGVEIKAYADEQNIVIDKVMRITGKRKDIIDTYFILEPVEWSDVTFVKKKK